MSETGDRNTRTHLHLAPPDPLWKLSPVLFAVVVFAFFLPFVTCNGTTVSGVQAATGITPPGSNPAAEGLASETMVPNPFALAALVCAGIGIALMSKRGRGKPFASALAGFVGVFMLGGFVLHVTAEARGELAIEFGLPLAVLGFLGTIGLNDLILARIPLLDAGDETALARVSGAATLRFTGLEVGVALLLFITAAATSGGDGRDTGWVFTLALIPVGVLALVALASVIRRFRRARPDQLASETALKSDMWP